MIKNKILISLSIFLLFSSCSNYSKRIKAENINLDKRTCNIQASIFFNKQDLTYSSLIYFEEKTILISKIDIYKKYYDLKMDSIIIIHKQISN